MTDIHDAAAQGYQKAAAAYVRGRPDYPLAVMEWVTGTLKVGTGTTVLELGAGTGKFTTLLAQTGADLIALDPVPQMLAALAANLPNVRTINAQSETIPIDAAAIDVVVCAQSFHWFANQRALGEIKRVLKPGGRLGLIWNKRDQRTDWVAALTDIMTPYEGDAPRHDKGDWKSLFPADGLTPLDLVALPHGHTGPADQVIVDRIMSVSFIAAQSATEQQKIEGAIRDLMAVTPALSADKDVTFPYVTMAYHAIRT